MGLLKTAVRVGVASSVHGRVQRRQQQRWAAPDQWQQGPPPAAHGASAPSPPAAPAPPPPGATTADKLMQLKALGELRDSGVLTEAEFELEKHTVLHG